MWLPGQVYHIWLSPFPCETVKFVNAWCHDAMTLRYNEKPDVNQGRLAESHQEMARARWTCKMWKSQHIQFLSRPPCEEQRDWVQSIEKWSDITDVSFLEATYRVGTRPSSGTIAKSKIMPTWGCFFAKPSDSFRYKIYIYSIYIYSHIALSLQNAKLVGRWTEILFLPTSSKQHLSLESILFYALGCVLQCDVPRFAEDEKNNTVSVYMSLSTSQFLEVQKEVRKVKLPGAIWNK